MIELQDIFNEHGDRYQTNHTLSFNQIKVMRAIQNCRTAALGGHVDECDECNFMRISYNSCRNRHCPKCQTLNKERWIEARKDDLLNAEYFHIVFTMPDLLNPVAYQNQGIIYTILFKAAAETLSELAADKKIFRSTNWFYINPPYLGSKHDAPSSSSLYCTRRWS